VFNRIAENTDVISFTLGEPDFTTPDIFIRAAIEALHQGKTHYTPNAGMYNLRSAIANSYPKERYKAEQVIITAGATEAILLTLIALVNPGDEVLITVPFWPAYIGQILTAGGIPKFVPTYEKDRFALKPENLEKTITAKTRFLIINSPANPSGAVTPREDLRAIADLAIKHNLIVLTDEVYKRIIYEGSFASIADFEDVRDRCVVLDSFSKTYAMTGWRIGYAIAPENIAQAMTKMHENTSSCVSAFAQAAALKALESGEPYIQAMVKEYTARRDLVTKGIQAISKLSAVAPAGAFYLYFNISETGLKARDFVFTLLDEKKVALVPGTAFGNGQESFIRMSYANSQENILKGIDRIADFVHKL